MTSFTAGIDIGSRYTRCVILDNEAIVGKSLIPTGTNLPEAATQCIKKAARSAEISVEEIDYIASTGFGRYLAAERSIQITDITCHARGAVHLFEKTQTVLDIGAMNSRAMTIQPSGRVIQFRTNEKCASGVGAFLERTAKALQVNIEDIGPLSLDARDPQVISSICAVLAESEVINHVTEGKPVEDILMGAHHSIADKAVGMLRQIEPEPEITVTGGLSLNKGFIHALQKKLGTAVNVHPLADYSGALGAALLSQVRLKKKMESLNR